MNSEKKKSEKKKQEGASPSGMRRVMQGDTEEKQLKTKNPLLKFDAPPLPTLRFLPAFAPAN
jgi:hypothetical protein